MTITGVLACMKALCDIWAVGLVVRWDRGWLLDGISSCLGFSINIQVLEEVGALWSSMMNAALLGSVLFTSSNTSK